MRCGERVQRTVLVTTRGVRSDFVTHWPQLMSHSQNDATPLRSSPLASDHFLCDHSLCDHSLSALTKITRMDHSECERHGADLSSIVVHLR